MPDDDAPSVCPLCGDDVTTGDTELPPSIAPAGREFALCADCGSHLWRADETRPWVLRVDRA